MTIHPKSQRVKFWWAVQDSNLRPTECKSDALPTELTARLHSISTRKEIFKLPNHGILHTWYVTGAYTMKVREKQEAISLRKQGVSMRDIAQKLGVAKSSVSLWVRDVPLTKKQYTKLAVSSHSFGAIEKRRQKRLANTRERRQKIMDEAALDVPNLTPEMLWLVGVVLYWGEGGKTGTTVRLSNSDPAVIQVAARFFREACKVSEEKMRGHVHTFSHANATRAEKFWSKTSGIPRKRLYRTYCKPSSASKGKRNTLPYGTFQIYVHDVEMFFKLKGWIDCIKKRGCDDVKH